MVDGPNNLVGRHALARMWPAEFQRVKEATCENFIKPFNYDNIGTNRSSHVVKAKKIDSSVARDNQ